MSYARVVSAFRNEVWAVREETFVQMQELVTRWSLGEKFSQEEVAGRIGEANARNGMTRGHEVREMQMISGASGSRRAGIGSSGGGTVALIPVLGTIFHRGNMFSDISGEGGTSVQMLTAQFRQAMSDPGVKAIVLDVDSPGGGVSGVFELADEIREARGRKKIIGVANSLAASAAYAICAAASELVVTPSAMVGSIGVFSSHEDQSKALEQLGVKITYVKAGKYKAEGAPSEPLGDETRAYMQSQVDDFYSTFVKSVAQSRRDSQANVRGAYGEGRTVTAAKAVRANLADRIATLDEILLRLGVSRPGMSMAARDTRILDAEDYTQSLATRRRRLWLAEHGGARTPAKATEWALALARRRRMLEQII
jgi:signal peptide peptidase SppA